MKRFEFPLSFPLRPTLVTSVIVTIALTIIATAVPAYYSSKRSIQAIWTELAKDLSEKTTERVLRYFLSAPPAAHLIRGLVDDRQINIDDPISIFDISYQTLLANPDMTGVYLAKPDGSFAGIIEHYDRVHYWASFQRIGPDGLSVMMRYEKKGGGQWEKIDVLEGDYDPRKRPYWNFALKHPEGGWTQPYTFLDSPNPGISYTLAQRDEKGLIGYWIFDYQINFLTDYLGELHAGDHGAIYIIADDGSLIAKSGLDPDFLSQKPLEEGWGQYVKSHRQSGDIQVRDHILYFNHFPKDSGIPWTVVTQIHEADFLGPIQRRIYQSMGIGFILCLLFTLISSIFFGRISHRLIEIARDLNRIGDLGLEKDPDIDRPSLIREVNTMNRALRHMKIALQSFAKYLPLELVKNLVHSGHLAELGGQKMEISILFSDLANFTSLTERISPDELVQVLDKHLTGMTEEVERRRGMVDKYIGDAVMALWGAPDPLENHALAACRAALAMKSRESVHEEVKQRIGVNTGRVIVGNFGSKDRMDYTAIGDPVNLASRLESLNKYYGTSIIIGESTAELVRDKMVLRPLDFVRVKGRMQPMLVYELIAEKEETPHALQGAIDQYSAALELYRKRDFVQSCARFEEANRLFGGADEPSAVLIKRCRTYQQTPPPQDWDGSETMSEK